MREVTVRVRHHGEPESDVSARHPEITLRSVSSLSGSGARRKRIVEVTGPAGSTASFLEAFAATDPVLDVERLSPVADGRTFVNVTYDSTEWDSIAARLTDLGVQYRVGTVIQAGWESWTLYLDADTTLSTVIDALEAAGNDTELVRDIALEALEGQEHLALSRIAEDLTDRQGEVLAVAIGLGYYDKGSDVTVADIADEVGLAQTTAWEHLSLAEETVMGEVGEYLSTRGV